MSVFLQPFHQVLNSMDIIIKKMHKLSLKSLRFSVCSDAILFHLCNTDVVKNGTSNFTYSANDLGDGIEKMPFPHCVEVGEDRVLDPNTPAIGCSGAEICTATIFTETLCLCLCVCACTNE